MSDLTKGVSEFRLPDDIEDIPSNRSGVYILGLRFPSDYELGLFSSPCDLGRVAEAIKRYVRRTSNVLGFQTLCGQLFVMDVADHLYHSTRVEIVEQGENRTAKLLASYIERNATVRAKMSELALALRLGVSVAPPLYVGMTAAQSFRARIGQHYRGETDFRERMERFDLDWSMLTVKCIEVEESDYENTRSLEKIIQALLKPKLSKR